METAQLRPSWELPADGDQGDARGPGRGAAGGSPDRDRKGGSIGS